MVAITRSYTPQKDSSKPASPSNRSLDANCVFDDDHFQSREIEPSKAKILVIGETGTSIIPLLAEQGYAISSFDNGFDALAHAPDVSPDLIISEIIMEGLDGLVVCESLKQMSEFTHVPIIFLTSRSDKKSVVRGLHAGASDYITKPFDPQEALARIKNHLQIRRLTIDKEKSNQILNHKNEELRQANEAKNKILGITTHDLKNPISSINGIAQFLNDGTLGDLNPEQKEAVRQILSASSGMLALVEDLLNASNLERNHIVLNKKAYDIAALVQEIASQCAFSSVQKNITIEANTNSIEELVEMDLLQIKRVLQNFISNAIKFSPSDTTVTVRLTIENEQAVIRVEDQGPGVPETEQCKLFKEFGQTSIKPTAGETSTGLGLNICRKLIDAHGGQVGMYNLEKRGSCFYFTLPL